MPFYGSVPVPDRREVCEYPWNHSTTEPSIRSRHFYFFLGLNEKDVEVPLLSEIVVRELPTSSYDQYYLKDRLERQEREKKKTERFENFMSFHLSYCLWVYMVSLSS